MKRILIVNRGVFSSQVMHFDEYEVYTISLFRNIPPFLKPFRAFHFQSKFPGLNIWEKKNIQNILKGYDSIILHDSSPVVLLQRFICYIENYSDSETKFFFYYWNSVTSLLPLIFNQRWELVSFDFKNSLKNKIRYVGGYYIPEEINNEKTKENADIFFIGINKGRFEQLFKLEKQLKNKGLKPLFLYVSKYKYLFSSKYYKSISYSKVINLLSNSNSVLDVTKDNQFGLSLRVYEAIFYNKKLITYNPSIQEYDFYDPVKILLIRKDEDIEKIKEFLSYPSAVIYEDKIKEKYSISSWLKRLDNGDVMKDIKNEK